MSDNTAVLWCAHLTSAHPKLPLWVNTSGSPSSQSSRQVEEKQLMVSLNKIPNMGAHSWDGKRSQTGRSVAELSCCKLP